MLYSDEVAQLLGKTAAAMARLIERGQLPFDVKTLVGRRCVSVKALAEWLESDTEPDDPDSVILPDPMGGSVAKQPSATHRRKIVQPKTVGTQKPSRNNSKRTFEPIPGKGPYSLAKKLAAMRESDWGSGDDVAVQFIAEALKFDLMSASPRTRGPDGTVEFWDFFDNGMSLVPIRTVYRHIPEGSLWSVFEDVVENVAVQTECEPVSVIRARFNGKTFYEVLRIGQQLFNFSSYAGGK